MVAIVANVRFYLQILVLLIGLASFCVIIFAGYQWIRQRSFGAVLATTAFVSACIQASQMLTALTGPSIIRYTIVLWPLFVICAAGIAVSLLKQGEAGAT